MIVDKNVEDESCREKNGGRMTQPLLEVNHVADYRYREGLDDGLTGWVATALLLVLVARAAQLWIVHIGCEQTWDDGAVQLARGIHYHTLGAPIYTDFRQPPYYALEYGPTIPVLESPLTRLFGSSV